MAEHSKIEWTDATKIVDRDGRRTRLYHPKDPSRPGQQLRRSMAAQGLGWCRMCRDWLPTGAVRAGLCKPHTLEDARMRYATDPDYRARRQAHATRHYRGVERVSPANGEKLLELFDGKCAYCPRTATTWDHVLAVSLGGITIEGNIVPCCTPCNSSKKNSGIEQWLDRAPMIKPYTIEYLSVIGCL